MATVTAEAAQDPVAVRAATHLRAHAMTWAAAGLLPIPLVGIGDPATSADVACLYLALASAWLASEMVRSGGASPSPCDEPESLARRRARLLGVAVAVSVNTAVFIVMGLAAGVVTRIPFPLLASLSVLPAVGLVPWLDRRARRPYTAIIVAALVGLGAKLAGCVVARIVYGPAFLEQGYVAGDWRTAKLMISIFWGLTTAVSLACAWDSWRRLHPPEATPLASAPPAARET